jgi:hypothetical protein
MGCNFRLPINSSFWSAFGIFVLNPALSLLRLAAALFLLHSLL